MNWGLWYCSNTTQHGNHTEKEASSGMETLQWFLGSWASLALPGSFLCLLHPHDSIPSGAAFQLPIPVPKRSQCFDSPGWTAKL